ncbi:Chromatin modification-related YNG2 [Paramuricea clavata]|uniref:Chromatin modification-related YNG2 n=1 Tax=Paramuricea clavata TaxID=317549 RepID=A0A7D9H866_PARCT|nr:Chromatin modification-related YNG2 [Paramuricea clavata]
MRRGKLENKKSSIHSIGLEIESDSDSACLAEDEVSDGEWISNSEESDSSDIGHDTENVVSATGTVSRDANLEKTEPRRKVVETTSNTTKTLESLSALNELPPVHIYAPDHSTLLVMLRENKLNWFAFVHDLKTYMKEHENEVVNEVLASFVQQLLFMDLDDNELRLIEQSRQAFLHSEKVSMMERTGLTDSESDDPEEWTEVKNLRSKECREMIKKQRAIIKRMAKRKAAKVIASRCLLKRKVPARVSKIVKQFPNIGKDIETFVRSKRFGADAWRRTGLTTFDGNRKTGPKASFRSIKRYLEEKYNRKIGYGTVVQLCVVRNKRRISAKRYKGIAKVTCRRARKGFQLKLNVDAHYSCAMYKGLDYIQLKDGRDKIILNRDDQAGFRLDTTYTHRQYKSLSTDSQEVTTHTDYVNKYSSVLQTSSYLFMATDTTIEQCAGVVKPHIAFEKNPSQHAADFRMVKTTADFEFLKSKEKPVDCIRVDGATDERPSVKEVQFLWTEVHLTEGKVYTSVTCRYSGGSFLNRVELMNGCLAHAHSNLFIPSTLSGFNLSENGLDDGKLLENLNLASDVYIDRVNGAPCGETTIKLFKGSKDKHAEYLKNRRPNLLIFLHGSKKARTELKKENSTQFEYFNEIWDLRNSHMIKDLPDQYAFVLLSCYKSNCIHPVCRQGRPIAPLTWFTNGPLLTYFPHPTPDPTKPWGGTCSKCKSFCSGHFMSPEENIKHVLAKGTKDCMKEPPTVTVKKYYEQRIKDNLQVFDEHSIIDLAKRTLLPVPDVQMRLQHLSDVSDRRKAGAVKAAATRKAKRESQQKQDPFCLCGNDDNDEMVMCENKKCKYQWFHYQCVVMTEDTVPDGEWFCPSCEEKKRKFHGNHHVKVEELPDCEASKEEKIAETMNMLAPMNANLYTNHVTAIHGAAEVVAKASMKSAAEETKQFYELEEDGVYDIGYWYYCGRDLETKGIFIFLRGRYWHVVDYWKSARR